MGIFIKTLIINKLKYHKYRVHVCLICWLHRSLATLLWRARAGASLTPKYAMFAGSSSVEFDSVRGNTIFVHFQFLTICFQNRMNLKKIYKKRLIKGVIKWSWCVRRNHARIFKKCIIYRNLLKKVLQNSWKKSLFLLFFLQLNSFPQAPPAWVVRWSKGRILSKLSLFFPFLFIFLLLLS